MGRCNECGKNHPTEKSKRCESCKAKGRKRSARLREDRKSMGLCECGKRPHKPFKRCWDCRQVRNKFWIAWNKRRQVKLRGKLRRGQLFEYFTGSINPY